MILFAHLATESVAERFRNAQSWQEEFCNLGDFGRRVLFTDSLNEHGVDSVFVRNVHAQGGFCLNALRNAAIDHAVKNDCEAVFLIDADSFVVKMRHHPTRTWSCPKSVWDWPDSETFRCSGAGSSVTVGPGGGRMYDVVKSSCFIIHSSVFKTVRFDTNYQGRGFNDWDYMMQLKRLGIRESNSGVVMVHRWHPETESGVREENRRLFYCKWGAAAEPH